MVIIDSEKDKPVMIERKKEMDNLGKGKMACGLFELAVPGRQGCAGGTQVLR